MDTVIRPFPLCRACEHSLYESEMLRRQRRCEYSIGKVLNTESTQPHLPFALSIAANIHSDGSTIGGKDPGSAPQQYNVTPCLELSTSEALTRLLYAFHRCLQLSIHLYYSNLTSAEIIQGNVRFHSPFQLEYAVFLSAYAVRLKSRSKYLEYCLGLQPQDFYALRGLAIASDLCVFSFAVDFNSVTFFTFRPLAFC